MKLLSTTLLALMLMATLQTVHAQGASEGDIPQAGEAGLDTTEVPQSQAAEGEGELPESEDEIEESQTGASESEAVREDTAASTQAGQAPAQALTPGQQPAFFSEPGLISQKLGFSALGTAALGAISFYSGAGIEALVLDDPDRFGRLNFRGVRYNNFSGAFNGGAIGMALGSGLITYWVGQANEEDGGFWMTLAGSSLGTVAALAIANYTDVEEELTWVPFVPFLTLPPAGALLGFSWSRWLRDKERNRKEEAFLRGENTSNSLQLHLIPIAKRAAGASETTLGMGIVGSF